MEAAHRLRFWGEANSGGDERPPDGGGDPPPLGKGLLGAAPSSAIDLTDDPRRLQQQGYLRRVQRADPIAELGARFGAISNRSPVDIALRGKFGDVFERLPAPSPLIEEPERMHEPPRVEAYVERRAMQDVARRQAQMLKEAGDNRRRQEEAQKQASSNLRQGREYDLEQQRIAQQAENMRRHRLAQATSAQPIIGTGRQETPSPQHATEAQRKEAKRQFDEAEKARQERIKRGEKATHPIGGGEFEDPEELSPSEAALQAQVDRDKAGPINLVPWEQEDVVGGGNEPIGGDAVAQARRAAFRRQQQRIADAEAGGGSPVAGGGAPNPVAEAAAQAAEARRGEQYRRNVQEDLAYDREQQRLGRAGGDEAGRRSRREREFAAGHRHYLDDPRGLLAAEEEKGAEPSGANYLPQARIDLTGEGGRGTLPIDGNPQVDMSKHLLPDAPDIPVHLLPQRQPHDVRQGG